MTFLNNWTFQEPTYTDRKQYTDSHLTTSFTYCPEYLKSLPFLQRLDYNNLFFITLTHILALLFILYGEFNPKTVIFAVVYYYFTGLSITAGYHRMYSHKAFEGNRVFELFVLIFGAGALQGSA